MYRYTSCLYRYIYSLFLADIKHLSEGVKYTMIVVLLSIYLGFCGWLMADFLGQRRKRFAKGVAGIDDMEVLDDSDGSDDSDDSNAGIQSKEERTNSIYVDQTPI